MIGHLACNFSRLKVFYLFFAFSRFTPGLGALGNTGGSSGSNGSNTTPNENTSPTTGTTEPGHQQFIQQMLQALAGVNPQVIILFC